MSSSKLVRSRDHRDHNNDNHGSTVALFGAMNGHSVSSGSASSSNGGANIWQLMNYPIPRGKCVHKPSVLLPACPCLRFMLNPLQAASSFACDGCGHHASFHNLKNGEEPAEALTPPVSPYVPEATKGAKKRGAASVHGAAVRGLVNGRASSNGAAAGGSATGRRGVGGIGALLASASASASEAEGQDDDVQVLDGDMLQVVKRSRGG